MTTNNKEKEQAVFDFYGMIKESWTWARLTPAEKYKFEDILIDHTEFKGINYPSNKITGSYQQRFRAYNVIYRAFLDGLGYDGPAWREPNSEVISF